MRNKKCIYFFFGCFSCSRNEKKMHEKKRKKKGEGKGWAIAQLCHNTMGNCIVTQQVLGVMLAGNCIATLGCWVFMYCNMGQLGGRVSVSQYTYCIVTEMNVGWGKTVS